MVQGIAPRQTESHWQSPLPHEAEFRTTTAVLADTAHALELPYVNRASSPAPLARRVIEKLNELGQLAPGWDSYGASAISELAINNARALLLWIPCFTEANETSKLLPYSIAPLANGGIQIEWRDGATDLEVEVEPETGEYSLLLEQAGMTDGPKVVSRRHVVDAVLSAFGS